MNSAWGCPFSKPSAIPHLQCYGDKIRQFIEEENRHTSWFHAVLQECEPAWYCDGYFHLLKAGTASLTALTFSTKRPYLFPCLLWMQLIAEERAQSISHAFGQYADQLDSRFVDVQRRHLEDEGDHILWDVELIEWLWSRTPMITRGINAHLLEWLLREFFYLPKRSGWNIVEHLMKEFPELEGRRPYLRHSMHGLARNRSYVKTLYPRSVYHRTMRLAKRWPELHFLEHLISD